MNNGNKYSNILLCNIYDYIYQYDKPDAINNLILILLYRIAFTLYEFESIQHKPFFSINLQLNF